jgi:hypothetical protein
VSRIALAPTGVPNVAGWFRGQQLYCGMRTKGCFAFNIPVVIFARKRIEVLEGQVLAG